MRLSYKGSIKRARMSIGMVGVADEIESADVRGGGNLK